MDEKIKENLKETATWLRGLYMLLFMVVYWVAEIIVAIVVFFQFLSVLITSTKNEKLLSLGQSLSTYIYQIMAYLTFNSEARPYPVGDWPIGTPSENIAAETVVAEAPTTSVDKTVPDKVSEDAAAKDKVKVKDDKTS